MNVKSRYKYSEVGKSVAIGKIKALTSKAGEGYEISFSLDYSAMDITVNKQNITKNLVSAPTPYKINIENNGTRNNKININLEV